MCKLFYLPIKPLAEDMYIKSRNETFTKHTRQVILPLFIRCVRNSDIRKLYLIRGNGLPEEG